MGSRANLGAAEKHPPIPESESSDDNDSRDAGISGPRFAGRDDASKDSLARRQSPTMPRPRAAISRRQSMQSLARKKGRQSSEPASSNKQKSGSPLSDITGATSESHSPGGNFEMTPAALEPSMQLISDIPGVSDLKYDIRYFLAYHKQYLTCRHYFLRLHAESFIQHDLLAAAVEYEPLLYAVVGFSAYHYSIRHPNGKLYTFLRYYNQSVSGLLKSLSSGDQHSDAMLLTILQLAAFEEYLGDWVSLVDHHQAAHRMLTELYTPEKINQTQFRREIFMWYSRFDVTAGLLAGNEMILSRDWYMTSERLAIEDEANNPGDLKKKYFSWGIRNRRFAMDMASLIAKASHGYISMEEFTQQNQELAAGLDKLQEYLDSLKDPAHTVMSYPHRVPLGPNDIVDPYVPGGLYDDVLWEMNYCCVDMVGMLMMYKYQTGLFLQQLDPLELQAMSLEQCRFIETMERWPNRPRDSLLPLHSAFGLAALFLPGDEKHTMWCRRILAKIEQMGTVSKSRYTYPPTFRKRMADLWKLPEVAHWWLPNDEGYPSLIREIREWTNERATKPRDAFREDLRDLKTMFWRMNVDDNSSQATSPTTTITTPTTSGPYPDHSPFYTTP
ncbi:hypothetical protein FQN50_002018 [Emmonsiellopsis sp. PD_5]|nr:hypothetical protein FQN50_002018 [Emmonsiellopsis sp. PD_5]